MKEALKPEGQDLGPGLESEMHPKPEYIRTSYRGSEKLKGKKAIVTGGDSGIGRAVCVHFAREGADIAIMYLNEHEDAQKTKDLVEKEGAKCILIAGDIGNQAFCREAAQKIVDEFGSVDILVNNAAEQHYEEDFTKLDNWRVEKTFQTNILGAIFFTKEIVPSMKKGAVIINCTSVTAYRGSSHLVDYAATKGAILAFTRALAANLVKKGIRVNGVAPGPIWTPFITSSFPKDEQKQFGKDTPMERPGQPSEVAPCFVFLASEDASYMTGQVLHPNGGEIVGG